jgi:S1-C subfamily serine protease
MSTTTTNVDIGADMSDEQHQQPGDGAQRHDQWGTPDAGHTHYVPQAGYPAAGPQPTAQLGGARGEQPGAPLGGAPAWGAQPGAEQAGYRQPGQQPAGQQPGAAGSPYSAGQAGAHYQHAYQQPGMPYPPAGAWVPPYAYGPQPPRRRKGLVIGIASGVVALSVVAGLAIGRAAWDNNDSANQAFGSVSGPSGSQNASIDANAIAQKVDPGLVDIDTVLGYQNAQAAGTGIVLTANGEILTNNHVVEGATSIKVTDIGNGKTYTATVVGYDRTQDIAVLQLQNASGLTTATLGDSSKVGVGDAVVGIGNAGGVGGTPSVAAGTVTALNQQITASDDSSDSSEQLTGLIQTNANIQAGDSGGSLVNSAGQVIGVDTAASAGSQQGQGTQSANRIGQGGQGATQGFAIPINQAISLAHQIIGGQSSSKVHIGQSAFLGVSVNGNGQGGAQIAGVLSGGAAQQAGLAQGDVITSVNGTAVDSADSLTNLMDTFHPGDSLSVAYTDASGQQHTVTVTAASGPIG